MLRDGDRLVLLLELAADAEALVIRAGDGEALGADRLLQHAASSVLTQVGEAARGVSAELRARHPQIPWPRVIAARNVVVHGYATLDWRIVWRILIHDLPELAAGLRAIVDAEFPNETS